MAHTLATLNYMLLLDNSVLLNFIQVVFSFTIPVVFYNKTYYRVHGQDHNPKRP